MSGEHNSSRLTRREFTALCASVMAASQAAGCAEENNGENETESEAEAMAQCEHERGPSTHRGRFNILLLLTDQERYFDDIPVPLPGRALAQKLGITFERHQIASNVCSPSRSVIYTGQHIQHTRVYDNVNAPWQPSMSTDIPTIGTMLRSAGYYTAYKGKFHLAAELERVNSLQSPEVILTEVLEAYGFADYYGIGDVIASTLGGYLHDDLITSETVSWLRGRGRQLADAGQPWFLAVNLINPHDTMYINTDLEGELVQAAYDPIMEIAPPPDTELYRRTWPMPLPESRHQTFEDPGRPQAHREFQLGRAELLGTWPNEDRRWQMIQDYYLNCISDCDRHIERVLCELDNQGLLDSTIIVLTSDHGELAGAHQMHGKGACAYREQNHVPLIIAHPQKPGGLRCPALTSHVDLVPTLLDMAEAPNSDLVGHSMMALLDDPQAASMHALRGGTIFSYNMLAYLDAKFIQWLKSSSEAGRPVMPPGLPVEPLLAKRGAIRSYFDGRYRFSRYFSPLNHHRPSTLEELLDNNDLELFDLESDPNELDNLARDPMANESLLISMNEKLNQLMDTEVGEDAPRDLNLSLAQLAMWALEQVDI